MSEDPLGPLMAQCRARIETVLDASLPAADTSPERLHAAMRYAVLGSGKRVRPILAYAAARATGVSWERVDAAAAALELIHASSLVHDDLPSLDDDDLRRGRPTCHKAFDEATALLAGDALQTLAFEVLATDPHNPPAARVAMVARLAQAAGAGGMLGGQVLDLASEGRQLDLDALKNLHQHKTGALIRAAVAMAAIAADTPPHGQAADQDPAQAQARAAAMDHYAACIGLAFQVQDDLLDVEGDTAVIGKTSGADAAHHKATYPSLLGVEAAHAAARALVDSALAALRDFGAGADPLRWIADYIIARDR
ncbi:farnesyl diphosphate synthase [uncultured Thiohalocapsa sp.]|uniref:polyprenyl synthetase family protein n=1 Tax=uncultured Thiohalocapsa sp. TaxID=768990 RepID=UPI0025F52A14|nr:farnesyl diphosphate synthase [uncultured Thiohalocapsa sp.]